jgi:hypothetical protein
LHPRHKNTNRSIRAVAAAVATAIISLTPVKTAYFKGKPVEEKFDLVLNQVQLQLQHVPQRIPILFRNILIPIKGKSQEMLVSLLFLGITVPDQVYFQFD